MNYIYDITVNLSKNELYEFYEWKEEDPVEFILKIPSFRIDKETFYDLKYNNVTVNKEFLLKIFDKTEVYTPNSINLIRYASVFSCDDDVIVLEFDSDGNNYMKSNLSIDEESEIIECMNLLKFSIIDYKIKEKKNVKKHFMTRLESYYEKYAYEKIKYMYENNEYMKLKYIFYELYNEKLDDTNKIYSKLINVIKNNDDKIKKLNEVLCLMDNKKIMSNNS